MSDLPSTEGLARLVEAITPAPQPEAATPTAQEAVPVDLTYQQKLEALSLRFYQGMLWTPKAGDYYTTSRADLELYRVVAVEGGMVKTQYCDQSKSSAVSSWPEKEFTSEGFGPKRVWVPDFVLSAHPPQPSVSVAEAAVDAAYKALPPDAHGTIGSGEMERVLEAAFCAQFGATVNDALKRLVSVLDQHEGKGPLPDTALMFCWMAAQDVRAALRALKGDA